MIITLGFVSFAFAQAAIAKAEAESNNNGVFIFGDINLSNNVFCKNKAYFTNL